MTITATTIERIEMKNIIQKPAPSNAVPVIRRRTERIDHLRSVMRLSAICPAAMKNMKISQKIKRKKFKKMLPIPAMELIMYGNAVNDNELGSA